MGWVGGAYQESTSHQDQNTTLGVRRLRVKSRDLVLDFLEGERLPRGRNQHFFPFHFFVFP